MCGIAGYISSTPSFGNPALLKNMCDLIRHRGPDGYGYYQEGPAALGHRRLSIIDVSGGAQPIGNEDGSVQIVFNGEIYNYLELRDDLIKKGHQFQTHSDTEVIVHLYEEVGEKTPAYLNGMFALAIWDARKQELFLARDPFGKKPLYYSTGMDGFRICFASELKSFSALPTFERGLDPRSIADFLRFGYVPDPATIFRQVRKLPPAHSLLLSSEGARIRRYWQLPFEIDEGMDYAKAREELAALAEDCVECRMMSEVPLGGFLSGGVDSGAVVAMMAGRSERQIKSFSIGFSAKEMDETRYARQVAERYHTEHHEQTVTLDIEEMMHVLVEHYDEPFADSSAIPTLYLSKMTRQHVTVALSGDGADELMGGYRRYPFALAEDRFRSALPAWFRGSVVKTAARLYPKLDSLPQSFRAKATLEGISNDLGTAYFEAMTAFRFGLYDKALSPALRADLGGYSPADNYIERFRPFSHLPPLQQMEAVDLETYLAGDILVKVDRASMAYSLEARCPWLDYRFGELTGRMPTSFKIRGGEGKYIFKDLLRKYLPDDILFRPKHGFGVPLNSWFRTMLRPVFEALVLRPRMEQWINLAAIREMWGLHQAGRSDYGREFWILLTLACWEDRYGSDTPGQLLAESMPVAARL